MTVQVDSQLFVIKEKTMKKILLSLILFATLCSPSIAADQWYHGDNTAPLLGTTKINDIDHDSQIYGFDPLNRVLANYRSGFQVQYKDASSITVTSGEIVVDSSSSGRLMLQNTSNTTVNWTNIDAGAEAVSTTYYVYAIAATSSSTTATFKISTNATSPTGSTFYKKIGSFYNDSSGNISTISNQSGGINVGVAIPRSINAAPYQATTNGYVTASCTSADTASTLALYTDSSSNPTTVQQWSGTHDIDSIRWMHVSGFVRAGDYYKVASTPAGSGCGSPTMVFIPLTN